MILYRDRKIAPPRKIARKIAPNKFPRVSVRVWVEVGDNFVLLVLFVLILTSDRAVLYRVALFRGNGVFAKNTLHFIESLIANIDIFDELRASHELKGKLPSESYL